MRTRVAGFADESIVLGQGDAPRRGTARGIRPAARPGWAERTRSPCPPPPARAPGRGQLIHGQAGVSQRVDGNRTGIREWMAESTASISSSSVMTTASIPRNVLAGASDQSEIEPSVPAQPAASPVR